MVSFEYLNQLLSISNASALDELDGAAEENRLQCLQLVAKQVDAKSIFEALEQNWDSAAARGALVSYRLHILCFASLTSLRHSTNILQS